jgi:hypothetical protein
MLLGRNHSKKNLVLGELITLSSSGDRQIINYSSLEKETIL